MYTHDLVDDTVYMQTACEFIVIGIGKFNDSNDVKHRYVFSWKLSVLGANVAQIWKCYARVEEKRKRSRKRSELSYQILPPSSMHIE